MSDILEFKSHEAEYDKKCLKSSGDKVRLEFILTEKALSAIRSIRENTSLFLTEKQEFITGITSILYDTDITYSQKLMLIEDTMLTFQRKIKLQVLSQKVIS